MDYIIKGKNEWNHHMFHGEMKRLQNEMNQRIGISADKTGKEIWMSYDEVMFYRKWYAEREREAIRWGGLHRRPKGIIEQLEEGDTRTPEERKAWESRVNEWLDKMWDKHGNKPVRDIDRELDERIIQAGSLKKDLAILKKRHRHE